MVQLERSLGSREMVPCRGSVAVVVAMAVWLSACFLAGAITHRGQKMRGIYWMGGPRPISPEGGTGPSIRYFNCD